MEQAQQTEGPKSRWFRAYVGVAMCVPPWNVMWWTVGSVLYFARMQKNDPPSSEGFTKYVLLAPATLPLIPLKAARDRFTGWRDERLSRELTRIASRMVYKLSQAGIRAKLMAISPEQGISIEAEDLTYVQWSAYRTIYEKAISDHPYLSPSLFLRNAKPLEPFDPGWAKDNNLKEYGVQVVTPRCQECGHTKDMGFVWGTNPQAECDGYFRRMRYTRTDADGIKYEMRGRICQECIDALGPNVTILSSS